MPETPEKQSLLDRDRRLIQIFRQLTAARPVQSAMLVDSRGRRIAGDMPASLCHMIASCGSTLKALGNGLFHHARFSRPGNRDIMIFPCGPYFLGIIKAPAATAEDVVQAVRTALGSPR